MLRLLIASPMRERKRKFFKWREVEKKILLPWFCRGKGEPKSVKTFALHHNQDMKGKE